MSYLISLSDIIFKSIANVRSLRQFVLVLNWTAGVMSNEQQGLQKVSRTWKDWNIRDKVANDNDDDDNDDDNDDYEMGFGKPMLHDELAGGEINWYWHSVKSSTQCDDQPYFSISL